MLQHKKVDCNPKSSITFKTSAKNCVLLGFLVGIFFILPVVSFETHKYLRMWDVALKQKMPHLS